MANKPRQLVLNAFFQRFGHHPAGWLHPSPADNGRPNLDLSRPGLGGLRKPPNHWGGRLGQISILARQ